MKSKAQVVVALDVDTFDQAKKLVDKLCAKVKMFKVGSQLFTGAGPRIIKYIHAKKAKVFLDLKYYDIPNTVASAVRVAASLKVAMLTLHISGGQAMMKAAIEEAQKIKTKRPLLIGVTVLTSLDASPEEVVHLARHAIECGLDGVVASVQEAVMLRRFITGEFILVTPGIRPLGVAVGDQKRVSTPEGAVEAGSDFLVVGRPIVEAKNPLRAAKDIIAACEKIKGR